MTTALAGRRLLVLLLIAALDTACSRNQPVELTPLSAQLSAVGPQGVEMSLRLAIHNPNSFAIHASAVEATLELQDGGELGRGSSPSALSVPAKADAELTAGLSMGWTNLARLAPYVLESQAVPYRVRGTARIGGDRLALNLPFTINGQLTPAQVVSLSSSAAGSLLPAGH
jgi:LEA14-like dessication related protein